MAQWKGNGPIEGNQQKFSGRGTVSIDITMFTLV